MLFLRRSLSQGAEDLTLESEQTHQNQAGFGAALENVRAAREEEQQTISSDIYRPAKKPEEKYTTISQQMVSYTPATQTSLRRLPTPGAGPVIPEHQRRADMIQSPEFSQASSGMQKPDVAYTAKYQFQSVQEKERQTPEEEQERKKPETRKYEELNQ